MRRMVVVSAAVIAIAAAGLISPPTASASHCSYSASSVLQSGSNLWGRGSATCSPDTYIDVIVCLQRWNGSSWQWANCSQQNGQLAASTGSTFYSLQDDCGSSTAFRSAFNIYVHGAWQGYKYGSQHNC